MRAFRLAGLRIGSDLSEAHSIESHSDAFSVSESSDSLN